jgi:hypothetical protein
MSLPGDNFKAYLLSDLQIFKLESWVVSMFLFFKLINYRLLLENAVNNLYLFWVDLSVWLESSHGRSHVWLGGGQIKNKLKYVVKV